MREKAPEVSSKFREHPGAEVLVLTPSEFEWLYPGEGKSYNGARVTLTVVNKDGKDVDQSFVLLKRGVRSSTVAHEIGHHILGHRYGGNETPEGFVKEELDAWVWAKNKRKQPLRLDFIENVIINTNRRFTEIPVKDLVDTLSSELTRRGLQTNKRHITSLIERDRAGKY